MKFKNKINHSLSSKRLDFADGLQQNKVNQHPKKQVIQVLQVHPSWLQTAQGGQQNLNRHPVPGLTTKLPGIL